MRRFFVIAFVLAATVGSADARHRHRHRHFEVLRYSTGIEGIAPFEERASRRHRRGPSGLADLVPRGWQPQPPDANWNGKRFLSPDGAAWFAAYSAPVANEPIAAHMKTIAFGDGEAVTYLRGERNWIAVSGVKGDRIFYRKAILACAGKSWHHIAFEYPVVLKREMDAFVVGAANIVDRTENEGCDDANPSVSQDSERPPGNSAAR
jgi:serine/threonine-protein kinase